ncbi:hemolymph lipopolysaccharide-binding protein-like isoform X2 [Gigantopelta aegis]|uniref:hemolymph lipopolysaccharide-binding protein-like isoform X2 n=1 Tax=Gigantopelta aegis TaxID=1735272 RepID=UPI001B88865A|nr:hemolymph lipopolysaccharide-binding protein-like isoform X2 [Gigantopelta aegis]
MRGFQPIHVFMCLIVSLRTPARASAGREWWMVRMTEMDKRMLPAQSITASCTADCGVWCTEDPTCTTFSYVSEKSTYPAGYRKTSIPDFVIRFHYYWELNWSSASLVCQQEGGRLVMANTEEKRELLARKIAHSRDLRIRDDNGFYVGAYAISGSDFSWLDGNDTPVDHSAWASGKPDGSGNCTVLLPTESFKLADENCDVQRPYICELM